MVKVEDIRKSSASTCSKGRIVTRLLYDETVEQDSIKSLNETAFYKKQVRVALRNCGVINPEEIDEYIAMDGYQALAKCLTEMTPEQVIQIVTDSGLRGRGGGGFPTGRKWSLCARQGATRNTWSVTPTRAIPARLWTARCWRAIPTASGRGHGHRRLRHRRNQGLYLCPRRISHRGKRLQIAIDQAREYGLLGKNIFDSGFDFDMEIRLGAGAFVCGEETALMTSIEATAVSPVPVRPIRRSRACSAAPRWRTTWRPSPTSRRSFCAARNGLPPWARKSPKGTKVFALGGKINNTGLVEIPMGTTLREIVEEIGGGIPGGKKFKAAQTGGPSGGCIPASLIDTKIDYDNLIAMGSMMGSGGLIVMDEDTCMVDIAKFFLEFTVDESCGKCTPCRVGTKRLLEKLDKITKGNGTLEDIDELESL